MNYNSGYNNEYEFYSINFSPINVRIKFVLLFFINDDNFIIQRISIKTDIRWKWDAFVRNDTSDIL